MALTEVDGILIKIGTDLETIRQEMGQVGTIVQTQVAGALQNVGERLTSSITRPLTEIGTAALKMGSEFQQSNIAFATMLGSAEKAKQFLGELRAFAASTPFEFRDLTQAATKMQALGFAAKDVLPMMRTIGDAVAGLGGGAQMIDRVTLALGQMNAKGKVSAQEMNQLAEAGIPAWDTLAKKIGISIPEAMKLAEKGALSSAEAIPAILAGMNEKFGGMMEKQAQTIAGQWSNLQDKLNFVLTDIGTQMAPLAASAIAALNPMLDVVASLAEGFKKLPPDLQLAAGAFVAMGYAAGPVMETMGSLGLAIVGLQGAFTTLGITAPAALLAVKSAAALAAAAFMGWNIGRLIDENLIMPFDRVSRAVDLVVTKIPGMQSFVKWMGGTDAANKSLADSVALLEGKLKTQGITIDKTGLSVEQYAKQLQNAANAAGGAKLGAAVADLEAKLRAKGFALDKGKMSLDEYYRALLKADEAVGKAGPQLRNLGAEAQAAAHKAAAAAKQMAADIESGWNKVAQSVMQLPKSYAEFEKAISQGLNANSALKQLDKQIFDLEQGFGSKIPEAIRKGMIVHLELAKRALQEMAAAHNQMQLEAAFVKASQAVDAYARSIAAWKTQNAEALGVINQTVLEQADKALGGVRALEGAFKTLGVTWSADLVSSANKYKGALDDVMEALSFGEASARDFYLAQIKYLEAQIAANKATGDSWVELQEQLDSAKRKLGEYTGEAEKIPTKHVAIKNSVAELSLAMKGLQSDLGRVWGGFQDDIVQAARGAQSLGEAFINAGRSIKDALINYVVREAFGAITGGLKDITSQLGGLGRSLAGLFGGGGGGNTPGVSPGSAPGVNPANALGGALSGVTGIVGMVGSIGTMVSSIVANFQNARMEKTMNAVEENTRYIKGYTLQSFEFIRDWLPWLKNTEQLLRLESIERILYEIGNALSGGTGMQSMMQPLQQIYQSLETFRETTRQQLQFISEASVAIASAVNKPQNGVNYYQPNTTGGNPITPQTIRPGQQTGGNNITVNVQQTTQNPYTMGQQIAGALNSALPALR